MPIKVYGPDKPNSYRSRWISRVRGRSLSISATTADSPKMAQLLRPRHRACGWGVHAAQRPDYAFQHNGCEARICVLLGPQWEGATEDKVTLYRYMQIMYDRHSLEIILEGRSYCPRRIHSSAPQKNAISYSIRPDTMQ